MTGQIEALPKQQDGREKAQKPQKMREYRHSPYRLALFAGMRPFIG